ncbi:hypothetical protein [Pseudomonas sp. NFX5]|uniref:hypothetical protein n=1 Tax=Pseudomonas sp. NFX5 TaxID=2816961 RepID=UPI003B8CD263
MAETTITNVLVIGNMARVQGRTLPGLNPLYFAWPGGTYLGQGWSVGGGTFDVTIGPLSAGGYSITGCMLKSDGHVNHQWSEAFTFDIVSDAKGHLFDQ